MSTLELYALLSERGVTLQASGDKLRFAPRDALTPELVEEVRQHKRGLMTLLRGEAEGRPVPPLPWQLERLVRAAADELLEVSIRGVKDTNRYVMGYACAYLIGDREHALSKLWEVRKLWERERLS